MELNRVLSTCRCIFLSILVFCQCLASALLLKAKLHSEDTHLGFSIGEKVRWQASDKDIVAREVGTVEGFADGGVIVKFQKGTWTFPHDELNQADIVRDDTLTVDDIAFGVLSCGKFLKTRLAAQRQTWLRHVRHLVVFSDEDTDEDLGVDLVVDRSPLSKTELLFRDGAWRALSMLETLRTRYPNAKWYFLVDDDTFVYVPNLLHDVLSVRDSTKVHYLGFAVQTGPDLKGLYPHQWLPKVAIGGAGIGISSGLMAKVVPHVPWCKDHYAWDWPGDVRIAFCIADLGYGVEPEAHLYAENMFTELRFGHGQFRSLPPASWHHVSPEDMFQLYAAQMVYSADGRSRADFSNFAMRTVKFNASSLNRSFLLRFGFSAEVSSLLPASNSTANSVLRADQLVHFRKATLEGGQSFEQEYRGDLCHAIAGRTVSVTAHLKCGRCEKRTDDADGLAVCRARMLDACAFELFLSMRCPEWERNVPIGLDIGTRPNTADVVHGGQVMAAWSIRSDHEASGESAMSQSKTTFFFSLASGVALSEVPSPIVDNSSIVSAQLGPESSSFMSGSHDSPRNSLIVEYECHRAGRTFISMELRFVGFEGIRLAWYKAC